MNRESKKNQGSECNNLDFSIITSAIRLLFVPALFAYTMELSGGTKPFGTSKNDQNLQH